jgi:hypothetical protein
MIIDVTDIDKEIVYNARPGPQTLKVIESVERIDNKKREYVSLKFVNQWEEYHRENFYPDWHRERLNQIAAAIGEECYTKHPDGSITFDTDDLVGGYFHATLTPVEKPGGELTDQLYIREIRASHRRKDTTGSRHFKRVRRKKKDKK